jgi:uncharacterized protein
VSDESEEQSIHVNFGRPMPIFPLATVTLLPQQMLPLHIFEPRYRQMVERALDGAGQLAMGVLDGEEWKQEYHGRPRMKRACCIGQIVQHEKTPDGRFNILVQGICRARILHEMPARSHILYREVMVEPVGIETDASKNDPELAEVRERLDEMLSNGPLTMLSAAEPICEYIRNESIPTHALLELISFAVVSDNTARYQLLEEASIFQRAKLILGEMTSLQTLIRSAMPQKPGDDVPKGCYWN